MTQDRLSALLFLFIEQELNYSVIIDNVIIDKLKNLIHVKRRLLL